MAIMYLMYNHTCFFSGSMPGLEMLDLQYFPSFHHKSGSLQSKGRLKIHWSTFCVSQRAEQPTKLNHCTKPPTANLRKPVMMPPHTARCRGNSGASTSSSYVSGYGCLFPFLGGGIDYYSSHWVSNQGNTGAEQLGMAWTETSTCLEILRVWWNH